MQRPYVIRPVIVCALALGAASSAFSAECTPQRGSRADQPARRVLVKEAQDAETTATRSSVARPLPAVRAVLSQPEAAPFVRGDDAPARRAQAARSSAARAEAARGGALDTASMRARYEAFRAARLAAAALGVAPIEAAAQAAFDRSHLMQASLAGNLRASYWLLQSPELMLGANAARAYRVAGYHPGRVEHALRRALYARLARQVADAQSFEDLLVLERIQFDLRSGWLDATSALAVYVNIEAAFPFQSLARRAQLGRALLIVEHSRGVARFDGAAARLLLPLLTSPESDIASAASDALWRLQHLRVGCSIPTLCGNDASGNELCLDEFRGRVVLVRFWSVNDPSAEALLGQDDALVERFWDHPFSLVGINRDPDRAAYLAARERIGFPGDQIYEGPLAPGLVDEVRIRRAQRPGAFDSWRERESGSAYLVDPHGVVRAVDPDPDQVVELIGALVNEYYRETRMRGF